MRCEFLMEIVMGFEWDFNRTLMGFDWILIEFNGILTEFNGILMGL